MSLTEIFAIEIVLGLCFSRNMRIASLVSFTDAFLIAFDIFLEFGGTKPTKFKLIEYGHALAVFVLPCLLHFRRKIGCWQRRSLFGEFQGHSEKRERFKDVPEKQIGIILILLALGEKTQHEVISAPIRCEEWPPDFIRFQYGCKAFKHC